MSAHELDWLVVNGGDMRPALDRHPHSCLSKAMLPLLSCALIAF